MCYMLKDENRSEICNFNLNVLTIENVCDVKTKEEANYLELQLKFGNEEKGKIVKIKEKEVEKISWIDLDERCRTIPNIYTAKTKRYLLDEIRKSSIAASKKKVLQSNDAGFFKIDGEVGFNTGEEIITSSLGKLSGLQIEIGKTEKKIDVDKKLSEAQVISEIFDLLSLSPNSGRIIFAHKLIYLMREAYVEAGITPRVCVYVYGASGTQKTTLSSFLTQLYDRSEGIKNPTRLNASKAGVTNIIAENKEDTIVLDDLFPADSKQICKQQEETLLEITRWVGDGIMPVKMAGKKVEKIPVKCGIVFTGEYLIGGGSDAARLLPVEMQKPDGRKLKYFQDNPLGVSTFYYFYIKWFVQNYKEIVEMLKQWLAEYRKNDLGIHARLQETHMLFNTAYVLMLHYCYEKGCLSSEEVRRLHKDFLKMIMELVKKQEQRVQKKASVVLEHKDYLTQIRELYRNGQLLVADSHVRFNKEVHTGVIHNNCLYLRGNKILAYFPAVSITDIANELISQGVLETGKTSHTKQISSLGGMRFLVIPLKYLE